MRLCIISIATAAAIAIAFAQDAKKPPVHEIKIVKAIKDCSGFEEKVIHPTRYILSRSKTVPYPSAMVYDIEKDMLKEINLRTLDGMPVPHDARGAELSRRKLEGGYWDIYDLDIIHYDGESNPAGALLVKHETIKTIDGAPACAKCGNPASFIEQYQRYYCYTCKEYVKESDYLKERYSYNYVSFDPAKNTVNWIEKIADGNYHEIGMDPEGKYFYFYDAHPVYKEETTRDSLTVYRFNVDSRNIDWRYTIKTPVRSRKTSAGSYTMNAFASSDYSRLVLWEYDEEYETGTRRGWLKDPTARAYIINAGGNSHFEISVPSTPYGMVIGRDNRYFLMGSNQYGTLHRVDLQNKKEDITIQGSKGMFYFTLSGGGKNLYIFTKTMVEVRSWPDLKMIKSIPFNKIIPGVSQLLTSEPMTGTVDGRYTVIGILEKASNGPWWSASSSSGFYLLSIGE